MALLTRSTWLLWSCKRRVFCLSGTKTSELAAVRTSYSSLKNCKLLSLSAFAALMLLLSPETWVVPSVLHLSFCDLTSLNKASSWSCNARFSYFSEVTDSRGIVEDRISRFGKRNMKRKRLRSGQKDGAQNFTSILDHSKWLLLNPIKCH